MKKSNVLKMFLSALFLSMLVFTCFTVNPEAATKKVDKAYNAYVKKLKKNKKFKNGIYTATMNVKKGNKILLVSTHVDDVNSSNYAYAYQYYNKKVRYIGVINTSGTAYPLMKKSKCVVAISTHNVRVLSVENGKGKKWEIDGLVMYSGYPITYQSYILKNNKKSSSSKKTISEKKAISIIKKWRYNDCKLITFKKR